MKYWLLLVFGLGLAWPACAFAYRIHTHHHGVTTTPPNDARLTTPPSRIAIHFHKPQDIAKGSIYVYDNFGQKVNDGQVQSQHNGKTMVSALPPLKPGSYEVRWQTPALSDSFNFTVEAHP